MQKLINKLLPRNRLRVRRNLRRLKIFRLLLVDVDGTITNGTKFYDQNHKVVAKAFNDRDFTAIKRFKAAGITVAFISADPWNKGMAAARNVDFWNVREWAKNLDKTKLLPDICQHYLVDPKQIAYVADDWWDNTLLYDVGFKFCPQNSCWETQKIVGPNSVILRNGGDGVLDSLYEWTKANYNIQETYPDDNA